MLMIHSVTNGLNRFCTWVMRLAYLNVLWILFSLAGLVVFGLMPATAAMFTVAREWAKGNTDAPVFSVFKFPLTSLFRLFFVHFKSVRVIDDAIDVPGHPVTDDFFSDVLHHHLRVPFQNIAVTGPPVADFDPDFPVI